MASNLGTGAIFRLSRVDRDFFFLITAIGYLACVRYVHYAVLDKSFLIMSQL